MFENMNERFCDLVSGYEYKEGYNYDPTTYGVNVILDEYKINKVDTPTFNGKSLYQGFSCHPAFDNDGKIVMSEKMNRKVDRNEISRFSTWIVDNARKINESIGTKFSVGKEVTVLSGRDIPTYYGSWVDDMDELVGKKFKVVEVSKIESKVVYVLDGLDFVFDERGLDGEANEDTRETIPINWLDCDLYNVSTFLTEEETEEVNAEFPWLKAHVGAKASRVVNKICRHYRLNEDPEYNVRFTRFADAINPLAITRWTILSINPIDFLTMSFGNSWASCHTIDKTNLRGMPNSYEGMYSGGTMSYMLDSTSFVMYTVDGSYDGKNYELQPKINRQMFHLGEDKLIQGRMYPQDNDTGSKELYDQFRAIAQRVIAECFGVVNLWTNKKGTSACASVTRSHGVHYRDYTYYENCNVSTLKGSENTNIVHIGHDPICIHCGVTHSTRDCIQCSDCCEEEHRCEECGEIIYDDDGIRTYDDHLYCCEACAERNDYVLCSDGEWHYTGSSDVMYDDYEGEYVYDYNGYFSNRVETRDGRTYTCPDNAIADGWEYCPACDEWVRSEYYNYDLGMCDDCAQEREEVTA